MFGTPESQSRSGKDRTTALLEEIATLEHRLEEMGMDGDCAYERAISRLYHRMAEERKQLLADLNTPTP